MTLEIETTHIEFDKSCIIASDTRCGELIAEWTNDGRWVDTISNEPANRTSITQRLQDIVDGTLESECESVPYSKWVDILCDVERLVKQFVSE